MILDSSAILAILQNESDAAAHVRAIEKADRCRISSATYVEVATIADARAIAKEFDALIKKARVIIEPLTEDQARIAREAYREYGKGNHAARLNLGDCFAYALSKDLDEPLLFKGEDFAQTDVEPALAV